MKRSLSKPKTKSKSPRKRKTKVPGDPTKKKKRKTTTTKEKKTKKDNNTPFYTVVSPVELLDKHIVKYQGSTVVKTASFTNGTYFYVTPWGKPTYCGGLHSLLKKYFYPDYNPKKKSIAHKTNMKSSTSSHGKIVDKQLLQILGKIPVTRRLAETKAILDYFESIGHIGQAAQLPVEIPKANRLTQADYITKCKVTGELWLWEVKTGGKNLEHEVATVYFNHIKGEVPCTQTNIWQIQLHFTRKSLEVAGVPIKQARVIQVGKHQFSEHVRVLVHPQPDWIKNIELNHIFEK